MSKFNITTTQVADMDVTRVEIQLTQDIAPQIEDGLRAGIFAKEMERAHISRAGWLTSFDFYTTNAKAETLVKAAVQCAFEVLTNNQLN